MRSVSLRSVGAALLGFLAVAGCGDGSNGPRAPVLSVNVGSLWDQVYMTWEEDQPEKVASYVVEHRQLPAPFAPATEIDYAYPHNDCLLTYEQEQTDHEFRLRVNYKDGSHLVSAVVPYHYGVRTPALWLSTASSQPEADGFHLVLSAESQVAEQLLLEKRVNTPGAMGAWSELPAVLGDTSFVDPDLSSYLDGAVYEYQVSLRAGKEWSGYGEAGSDCAKPLPPTSVSAVAIPGGLRISLTNASTWANRFDIRRNTALGESASVDAYFGPPPPVGVPVYFDDLGVTPGAYRYALQAEYEDVLYGGGWVSPEVDAWVLSPPPDDWGLKSRLVQVSPGTFAARLPSGDFAVGFGAFTDADNPFSYHYYLTSDQSLLQLPFSALSSPPGVALDVDGHPHSVYLVPPFPPSPSDDSVIVHAWYDGRSWQSEEIARRASILLDAFDFGLDGVLRVTWGSEYTVSSNPELATLTNGSWSIETIGSTELLGCKAAATADAGGNVEAMAWCGGPGLFHGTRDDTGWHVEEISYGSTDEHPMGPPEIVAPFTVRDGRLIAFASVYDYATRSDVPVLLQRDATGWLAPQTFAAPLGAILRAARSRDGARLVVSAAAVSDATAIVFDQDGAKTLRWQDRSYSPGAVGFDLNAKVWILYWLELGPVPLGGTVPAVVYEEP